MPAGGVLELLPVTPPVYITLIPMSRQAKIIRDYTEKQPPLP